MPVQPVFEEEALINYLIKDCGWTRGLEFLKVLVNSANNLSSGGSIKYSHFEIP